MSVGGVTATTMIATMSTPMTEMIGEPEMVVDDNASEEAAQDADDASDEA